ncbi:MAG: O-antigen ligase family protein [Patescibacteria group bacterium]|nr:O-antigen ligase family protein [Patescibacteria group bacterium]MDD5490842.1 O-antigen ligase family protein [Patescibacteria group bacterium]
MVNVLVLIIFCLSFAILAWRKTLWGLAIILFLLPIYLIRFHLGFIPMTLLEAIILILFAIWLIKSKFQVISYEFREKFRGWILPIAIFFLAATIAVFVSPDKVAALGIWKAYFVEPILFLIVLVGTVKKEEDLKILLWALGGSAIYLGALAIYQKFTGYLIPNADWFAPETRRVTGVYGYPNAVGLYLAPLAVLYFGLLIQKLKNPLPFGHPLFQRGKGRDLNSTPDRKELRGGLIEIIFYLAVIILSLLGIIFAVSEGAMVGVMAGIIFLALVFKKTRYSTVVLIILAVVVLQFQPVVKNLIREKATLSDVSGKIRLEMWGETWQMLKDHPLTGAGLAGYQTVVAPYHKAKHIEIYLYPHNVILNFWSELGILGLIGFLWIIIKFFWQGLIKIYKNVETRLVAALLLAMMVTILIHGLVDVPYFKNDLAILFWFIVGGLICLNNFDRIRN